MFKMLLLVQRPATQIDFASVQCLSLRLHCIQRQHFQGDSGLLLTWMNQFISKIAAATPHPIYNRQQPYSSRLCSLNSPLNPGCLVGLFAYRTIVYELKAWRLFAVISCPLLVLYPMVHQSLWLKDFFNELEMSRTISLYHKSRGDEI